MTNCITQILDEAMAHRALNHPYLIALENGDFPNPEMALKDFAEQYLGYTNWFPRYLTGTISKLDNPKFRMHLIENLSEESGMLEEEELEILNGIGIKTEWVQGIPHPELFRRFQRALYIDHSKTNYCDEVLIWRELFYNTIISGSKEESIGALGLGTEAIVKFIYRKLINSIKRFSNLSLEEYVFFELHTEVDDEHGKILLEIAEEMASNKMAIHDLRKGMLKALSLRAMFWDAMYERALKFTPSNNMKTKQIEA